MRKRNSTCPTDYNTNLFTRNNYDVYTQNIIFIHVF